MAREGQPESGAEKSKFIFGLVLLIAVLILVYIFMTSGFTGVTDLIKKWITYAVIAAVIGLIIWVVMKLFSQPKIDVVSQNLQDIIDAGILSKPPMVKDIYFTGDKEHGEFKLGKIIGYCQIQSYKELDKIANLTDEQLEILEREGKIPAELIIKEDCFIFKRFSFPMSLFEKPKVLKTLEHEHSQIIGDVKVYAVSVISRYSCYYPNRAYLDVVRIDIATIREAWRGVLHQYLKDSISINQRAVGLDSEHKKDLEIRKMLKLPTMGASGNEDERRR